MIRAALTEEWMQELLHTAQQLEEEGPRGVDLKLHQAEIDGLRAQAEDLRKQINEQHSHSVSVIIEQTEDGRYKATSKLYPALSITGETQKALEKRLLGLMLKA